MESLFWCLLGIFGIVVVTVGCTVIASFVGLSAGLIGLIARKWTPIKEKPILTWLLAGLVAVCGAILFAVSYGVWKVDQSLKEFATQSAILSTSYAPQYFNADNEEMWPFIVALNAIDRASLGFTPIPAYARVEIDRTVPPATYDVMLHIYADTSRTVAFKKEGDGYVWVGEQETHIGPTSISQQTGIFTKRL